MAELGVRLLGADVAVKQALKHLTDIKLEYLDTKQAGFKLLFSFSPNEFFEDSVLTKTYYYQVTSLLMGSSAYTDGDRSRRKTLDTVASSSMTRPSGTTSSGRRTRT